MKREMLFYYFVLETPVEPNLPDCIVQAGDPNRYPTEMRDDW